jgi:predicted dehydrogenase
MDNKLKVGVIGTGFIGPIHIENARRTFKAEVIALVEKDMDTARTKAEMYDVPLYYDDHKKLLENEEIDVVHIIR